MIQIDTWTQPDCTIGRLEVDGFRCFTLELPWRNNAPNVSCIPDGEYPAMLYQSPHHGETVLLEDVPGRSMIEIHPGNYTSQIRGCILVGDSIRYLDDDGIPDVTNSRETMARLLNRLSGRFTVQITRI